MQWVEEKGNSFVSNYKSIAQKFLDKQDNEEFTIV